MAPQLIRSVKLVALDDMAGASPDTRATMLYLWAMLFSPISLWGPLLLGSWLTLGPPGRGLTFGSSDDGLKRQCAKEGVVDLRSRGRAASPSLIVGGMDDLG